ncbi:histidine phosphatase family protein [Flavobacterium sp. 3HN19-14]|uniref:histidine phosphatase family protein n=1 Tax=Flavobacterium sp. 3HN19-14 TaxID=3448133 RepID=UPI003EE0133E
MKKIYFILISIFMQNMNAQNEPLTTIYLFRHAEKAAMAADPELSEAGKQRAQFWMQYFENIPVDLIYSTQYKRTQSTAFPLASKKDSN